MRRIETDSLVPLEAEPLRELFRDIALKRIESHTLARHGHLGAEKSSTGEGRALMFVPRMIGAPHQQTDWRARCVFRAAEGENRADPRIRAVNRFAEAVGSSRASAVLRLAAATEIHQQLPQIGGWMRRIATQARRLVIVNVQEVDRRRTISQHIVLWQTQLRFTFTYVAQRGGSLEVGALLRAQPTEAKVDTDVPPGSLAASTLF